MANVNARRVEEILTSGITAGHYVAGSNITITENQDGTETIASTGGGGGGGFTPTETQLAAMNSGITEAKVTGYDALPDDEDVKDIVSDHFVAGSNITITDNVDGTQTIASTASGGTTDYSDLTNKPSINNVTLSGDKTTSDLGIDEVPTITSSDGGKYLRANYYNATNTSDYSWANIPSVNEVPQVTSSDQGKVLTATYRSGAGSYSWGDLPNALKGIYQIPSTFDARENHIIYGGPTNVGLTDSFALYTETGEIQSNGYQIATAIGSNHKLYFKFKPYGQDFGNWIALDIDALSNYSAAPTAYTTPTYDSSYVDTQQTSGGYVIDNNNICTVNIAVKFSSDGRGEAIASGLPRPAYGSLTVSASVHNTDINKDPGFFTFAYGDLYFDSASSINMNELYYLNVSYLVDTST